VPALACIRPLGRRAARRQTDPLRRGWQHDHCLLGPNEDVLNPARPRSQPRSPSLTSRTALTLVAAGHLDLQPGASVRPPRLGEAGSFATKPSTRARPPSATPSGHRWQAAWPGEARLGPRAPRQTGPGGRGAPAREGSRPSAQSRRRRSSAVTRLSGEGGSDPLAEWER